MDDSERQRQLIIDLSDIAGELGWLIAIPTSEDETTSGLIMGTQEFLLDILGDSIDQYEVMSLDGFKINPSEGLH